MPKLTRINKMPSEVTVQFTFSRVHEYLPDPSGTHTFPGATEPFAYSKVSGAQMNIEPFLAPDNKSWIVPVIRRIEGTYRLDGWSEDFFTIGATVGGTKTVKCFIGKTTSDTASHLWDYERRVTWNAGEDLSGGGHPVENMITDGFMMDQLFIPVTGRDFYFVVQEDQESNVAVLPVTGEVEGFFEFSGSCAVDIQITWASMSLSAFQQYMKTVRTVHL